jgi:hypothetical protein
MTSENKSDSWIPESFRLTAFIESKEQTLEHVYWQKLFDESPEQKVELAKKPLVQESGTFQDAKLVYSNQLTRLDWNLGFEPSFETVMDVPQEHINGEPFAELMKKWLELCPPVTRLALGTVVLKSVKSSLAGFEELSKLLPFKLDPDSSDFFYQINRPRKSKVIDGLTINRLSKWNVVRVVRVEIPVGEIQNQGITREDSFCRLELDINTSGDLSEPLPKDKLINQFEELLLLTKEIISKGDCK